LGDCGESEALTRRDADEERHAPTSSGKAYAASHCMFRAGKNQFIFLAHAQARGDETTDSRSGGEKGKIVGAISI
jgi:hypothetical protein